MHPDVREFLEALEKGLVPLTPEQDEEHGKGSLRGVCLQRRDACREQIIRDCWVGFTGDQLDQIITRNPDVVVVLYTTVRDMLGQELRTDVGQRAFPLKFRRP